MTTIHYSRPTSEQEALDLVLKNPLHLKFLHGQTPEIALEAVKADWRALQFVENRTPEMETEAIRQNPEVAKMLKSLGDAKQNDGQDQAIVYSRNLTEEQAIRLVEERPYNFQHIKNATDAVCEAALKADPWKNIEYIPKDRMTPEWKMIAAQAGCLGKIDNPTYDMCLASVRHAGKTVRFAPKEMRSLELLDAAIAQNPASLAHFEPDEKIPELCMKAVAQDGKALQFVEKEMQTMDMCMSAVLQNPENIRFASRMSEDLRLAAVRRQGNVIRHIPDPSKGVCLEAVRNDPKALFRIDPGYPSRFSYEDALEIYVEAVKGDPFLKAKYGECNHELLMEAKALVRDLQEGAQTGVLNPMENYEGCLIAVQRDAFSLRDVIRPAIGYMDFSERIQNGYDAETIKIEKHMDLYRNLCEMAVRENGLALEFVDKDAMSDYEYRGICIQAINQNPMALKFADKKGQDPWVIRNAVLTDPMSIQYAWRQEADLCRFAVDRNGYALQFLRKQTPELCMAAVNRTPYALKHVKKQTREICRAAVGKDPGTKAFVKDKSMLDGLDLTVSQYDDTENMRKVRANGYELGELPESERTPEVCRIALEQNPYALKFVPDPTLDMYLMALKEDHTVLGQVQKHRPELLNEDSYMRAVQANPCCFRYVPDKFKTEEMCMVAVRGYGYNIEAVPRDLATEEMCMAAVLENPKAFRFIPEEHKTEEICIHAVGKMGMNLAFVPEELRTPEMERLAVDNDPMVADCVKLKSEDAPVNAMRM